MIKRLMRVLVRKKVETKENPLTQPEKKVVEEVEKESPYIVPPP